MPKNHPPCPATASPAASPADPAPKPAAHELPTASATFQVPPFLFDGPGNDEVVWEDDFRQTVKDVAASRRGVEQLRSLLYAAHDGPCPTPTNLLGLSVLLEGVEFRLSAAVDGVVDASKRMGFAGAFDLPGVLE
jgi:hypothetical protein